MLPLELCLASQRALLYLVSRIVFHLSRHIKFPAASSVARHPFRISRSNLRIGHLRNYLGGECYACIIYHRTCNGVGDRCHESGGQVSGACHRSNIFQSGRNSILSVTYNLKYCNASKHVIHIITISYASKLAYLLL